MDDATRRAHCAEIMERMRNVLHTWKPGTERDEKIATLSVVYWFMATQGTFVREDYAAGYGEGELLARTPNAEREAKLRSAHKPDSSFVQGLEDGLRRKYK